MFICDYICFISWFDDLILFLIHGKKIYNNKGKKERLESVYTSLLNDEANLEDDVKKLQDPEYVAKYAREKNICIQKRENMSLI